MVNVGSDFSGVGAFDQALKRLDIKYNTVFSCDMDKFARQTYIENYGEPKYYPLDVYERKIPKESLDIYMTSPPCQAFSLAGKRKGEDDKRGVLFYNSHEFILKNKPRYFIFENVKGLLSDAKGRTFQIWLDMLGGKSVNGNPVIFPREDATPYHIYYKVLNAKHYGVPQNRERVFIIGIRDDKENNFHWPKPFHLTKRLKDVLEDNVDEKFYLSDKMINMLQNHSDRHKEKGTGFAVNYKTENDSATTIRANGALCPTDNIIKIKSATKKGYEVATENDSINFSVPNSETRRGRVGKEVAQTLDTACNQEVLIGAIRGREYESTTQQTLEINKNNTSNTITSVQKDNVVVYDIPQIVKVRKHNVNVVELQKLLKKNKILSNKEISNKLKVEKTTVDHWFRKDKSFSIPDANVWYELKSILKIKTNEFDKQITEFVERPGIFEKSNRVYGTEGLAPTMTSASADEKIIQLNNPKHSNDRVYHQNGLDRKSVV